jgi:hypothetical protein
VTMCPVCIASALWIALGGAGGGVAAFAGAALRRSLLVAPKPSSAQGDTQGALQAAGEPPEQLERRLLT